MEILIATNNAHKLQEFGEIFALAGAGTIKLITPRELGLALDPEENAATYVGNARIKARAFRQALRDSGARAASITWVLADDSGLEVDALDGRPGLRSARYHKDAPHGDGCVALLRELANVPDTARTARFRALLVAVSLVNNSEYAFEGVCLGAIAHEKRGVGGFGFDPVFLTDGVRTMSEITSHEKHVVSHRGLAARRMIEALRWNGAPRAPLADSALAYTRAVKARCEAALLRTPGAVGLGIGQLPSGEPALVLNLARTTAFDEPSHEIEDVPVVLQETGTLKISDL
ncbi:MAG: non-canonical purine NTP pyrophosphatase [Chloroflexi bacterium]|nr:non-canonical purine NTP pyrophosphatase [Chloroflexota bacterium]